MYQVHKHKKVLMVSCTTRCGVITDSNLKVYSEFFLSLKSFTRKIWRRQLLTNAVIKAIF